MSNFTNYLIFSILIIFVGISALQNANAITITTTQANGIYISKSSLIGIQLSPTCLALIKNHMKTNCPTYDKLQSLDNTNPIWAGQWYNDTYYHRHLPRVSNHYMMNPNPFVVMVDPDPNFTTIAKMIIIQPDNFTYINPNESIGMNHTRNEYNNRFVSNCTDATVAPIFSLINDTIYYIESNCTSKHYNEKITVKTGDKAFDYKNPYSSLYYKYQITYMKQHPMKNCINYKCDIKDPYKNPRW